MNVKKIFLVGYMGVGKSTVAPILARQLGMDFIDLDAAIEAKEQLAIPEIFAQKGALYFRKSEHQLFTELLHKEREAVVALGGGTPCYYDHMQLIADTPGATAIYLQMNVGALTDRLWEGKGHRPLLSGLDTKDDLSLFIGKNLFERRPYYMQAGSRVNVDGQCPKRVSDAIRGML